MFYINRFFYMPSSPKKTKFLSLNEVCVLLGISTATGRNWIRLGKLVPENGVYEKGKSPLFSKKAIESLLDSIKSGDDLRLKSRRNKTALIRGREFYVNYISRKSPNHNAVSIIVNDFKGSLSAQTAILGEAALQLLKDSGNFSTDLETGLFRAWLDKKIDAGVYNWLIEDLSSVCNKDKLKNASAKLPEIRLHFVPFEDTLGLIYLSLMELQKKRQEGRYYTPQPLTDTSLETLSVTEGRVFLDPSCGSGNFLLRLLKRGAKAEDLYGCDLDSVSVTLARLNFVMSGKCTDRELLTSHLLKCDAITAKNLPRPDVIIGNPPWGCLDDEASVKRYSRTLKCASRRRPCFADLFVERSLSLLGDGGILQFVLPEALLNVASHEEIREIISKSARVKSVRYLGEVFHAVQCPSVILTLEKTSFAGASGDVIVNVPNSTYVVRRKRDPLDFNFKITDSEAMVLDKMEDLEHCVKLKGYAKFALGIVTGSNNDLLSDRKSPGFEPVLRGTDIEPFKIREPKSFIRFDEERLQQVAPIEFYRAKEKIVYRFIARYPIAAVDSKGTLTLNSCNLIVPCFENMS
ncbi:MAG: N-6 DNA methylase, partial [Succinivibrio sp.]